MSILEISNLSHGFGDRTLFKNVNIHLSAREHVALIGRNGAGKSTLFNLITDQISHDQGHIRWQNGIKIGFLTQHAKLSDFLTINDALLHAFDSILSKERTLQGIATKLANATGKQLERLLEQYANLQDELEREGIYEVSARIQTVADGLGILELGLDHPVAHLSGGQRTKVLLAQLLLQQCDVLLLDEPTNFLDVSHINWLSNFLKQYEKAFLVISHDALFLNQIADVIWSLENTELVRYSGSYSAYLSYASEKQTQQIQAYSRQQQEIKRMEDFIEKNIARASTTKRAQSRRKALEKMDRITTPTILAPPSFSFKEVPASAKIALEATNLIIGYTHPLLPALNLLIEHNSKIALTGCNGIGKSTLLRTLLGELPPLSGEIHHDEKLKIGYFAQEEYEKSKATPLDRIWQCVPDWPKKDVLRVLARSGLKHEHMNQPIHSLSGGEQAKVRLCKLTLQPANFLLFDEPTNHLDQPTKDALNTAMKNFTGTLILVSHEPAFYKSIVDTLIDLETLYANGKETQIIARHFKKTKRH
ncbi:ABC-F family ATP-binding cassette domain-containing protein [Sulfoacidibacillus thermotolerans]|uniref:ABC transporter domain-containing protein n=1 Tax=Sulfoacidibacillus thermotolerans TaxID=1765684 RepID=A0A2U3DC52_SULT2|nr:ABC-F family ATP-binding cassette domain-containing protein [Sulfoacidibacillus thermotolerans]PWI58863.1 hypothetical protein BM613_01890 [Sulfoacidibacillus thermotolerans]